MSAKSNIFDAILGSQLSNRYFTHYYIEGGRLLEEEPSFFATNCSAKPTIFDVASLTKAIVTTPLVFEIAEQYHFSLQQSVNAWLEERMQALLPQVLGHITIHQLLSHTSGLPAWRNFFTNRLSPAVDSAALYHSAHAFLTECWHERTWKLDHIGEDRYSDVGFILLGWLLESVTGHSLDQIWQDYASTLGFSPTRLGFSRQLADPHDAITTGFCPVRQRQLVGEVHDENCASLGGVAGHAGLFADGPTLGRFLRAFSSSSLGQKVLSANSQSVQKNGSGLCGWRLGNDPSADVFGRGHAMGHLGFTGTAFWVDLEKNIYALFLTNRVVSGRISSEIKTLRRDVFALCYETLTSQP